MKIIRATSRTEGYMCDFCGEECCDYETAGEQHRCIVCVAAERNELREQLVNLQVIVDYMHGWIRRAKDLADRGVPHV